MLTRIGYLVTVICICSNTAFAARGGARLGAPTTSDASATATAVPNSEKSFTVGDSDSDNQANVSAGLGLGLAFPSLTGKGARFNFGFNMGIDLNDIFQFALYFTNSSQSEAANAASSVSQTGSSITLVGAQLSYVFHGKLTGLMVGPMVGLGVVSVSNNGSSGATLPFSFGLHAGYDYFIGEHFSFGPDISYLFVLSKDATSFKSDSFQVFNAFFMIKYWE